MEKPLLEQFEKIFVHVDAVKTPVGQKALSDYPQSLVINDVAEASDSSPRSGNSMSSQEFDRSKRLLYIAPHKGRFFKQCPGALGAVCCNYYVLNLGLQCNMNCSYCYLQSYINTQMLTIHSNLDHALHELDQLAHQHPEKPFRVGTGETTDSLSLDELTGYATQLVRFFRNYPKWTLEFKTKSSKIENFINETHSGNVVVSWSINPSEIVNSEEHGTASLPLRLVSARKVLDHKFKVAFHIDPMIWHPEWKENYAELVDLVASHFEPQEVPSITVGALRFPPIQRLMMKERFGMKSLVNQGEMFITDHGKLRYDQELRTEMFNFVMDRFRSHDSQWKVWLCMENSESWTGTYAATPLKVPGLKAFFEPLPRLD